MLTQEMDAKTRVVVHRALLVMLLGELFGLHTLNQVLQQRGIRSNNLQKVWQKMTCAQTVRLMNSLMWQMFEPAFRQMCRKSASTHSRGRLTLVVDGSIFQAWLSGQGGGKFFNKYFSGQTRSAVYGFNLLLGGMTMDGVFYPLHFYVRRKEEKDPEVAVKMLCRVQRRLSAAAGGELPRLYGSVDSGFSNRQVVRACQALGITFIGVPKSKQVVYVNGEKRTVGELARKYGEQVPVGGAPRRLRVKHQATGMEVALLLFRLDGSDNVSAIMSPDLDCKGKTLRRHWFERTRIEQFFRTIKHDLKVRQSTVSSYEGFVRKISLFLLKALFVNLLTRHCQRSLRQSRKMGFASIRDKIIYHGICQDMLDHLLTGRPFADGKLIN